MTKQVKIAKLLAPTVPLVLQVEEHKLELKLAWTMRGVAILETKLREIGIIENVLQNPSQFWTALDSARLTFGVWAMSRQENPEYSNEEGLETISSFMTMENYGEAATGLKACFLESLSEETRKSMADAAELAEKAAAAGETPADPTVAPTQQ